VEQGTLVNLPSPSEVGAPLAAPGKGAAFLFGRVLLNGVPPPEVPIKMGPACGEAAGRLVTTRHYVVGRLKFRPEQVIDRGLADVLVWLKNVPPAPALLPAPVLNEVGCMFQPYV